MANSGLRPQRADWQRNHEQLLAAAAALIAHDGAQVSLEEVAREAGVGSATLHRHFPSRRALLEEVFHDVVERFRLRGIELACADPRTGLLTWLEELTISASETRGLTASLEAGAQDGPSPADSCHGMVREATVALMDRALAAGAIRPEVSPEDLLALVTAISQVTEGDSPAARRLLRLAFLGVQP